MRLISAVILVSLILPGPLWAAEDPLQTVREARAVIRELVSTPEQDISPSLLNRVHALAIMPNLIKAGFILCGSYGQGIILVRGENGEWCTPVFIKHLAEASAGKSAPRKAM